MEKPRYIVIEGPIGVGKTSLAGLLAKELEAKLFLENAEKNPFLEAFYRQPDKYAFQTQVFFLLSRFTQQQELIQEDLFNQNTVSDYLFSKDRIFAHINLRGQELSLYEQIYRLVSWRITSPDLVIYLQARTEVLLDRIKKRSVPYEKWIDFDYMKKVVDAYNDFFFYYKDSPLLVVNTSDIDFISNREDFEGLIKEIKGTRRGTWHYIPLGSQR